MADYNKYHNGDMSSNGSRYDGEFTRLDKNPAAGQPDEDEIDLKEIIFMVWARKWFIGGFILLCGILGYIIASTMTPIYQSEGSLLITNSGRSSLISENGLASMMSSAFGLGGGSSLENELLILKSRSLSMALADSLIEKRVMKNGKQFPVLYTSFPDDSTIVPQDTVAAKLQQRLTFSRINAGADFIHIAYESPSPLAAAYVVNETMNIYTAFSTRRKSKPASAAVKFLKQERARIQDSLYQAEEALRAFMNKSGLIQVDTQTEALIQQLATLEAKLYGTRSQLGLVNTAIAQYEQQLNKIKPGLTDQLAEATSSNMKRLQFQLAELELQKTRLLTRNPGIEDQVPVPSELVELNRKIDQYQNKIKNLTQELLKKGDQYLSFLVEGEVAANIAQINARLVNLKIRRQKYEARNEVLSRRVAKLEQFFNNLPNNIIKLARLKREVMLNEKLFASISEQYAQMALLEETQFGLGRPIDRGYIPDKPVKPRTLLFVLIGMIIGGIGSIGYVFTKEAFNTTIDGVEKMRTREEPLLSVIPQMHDHTDKHHDGAEKVTVQGKEISTKLVTVLDSISPISESFRRLQSNLIYSNPDRKLKSIVLTSAGKGAGKSTTISNLGVVLAESGHKVVIVETDLRRPNVHNVFGLQKTPGFMEILFDDIKIEEAMQDAIMPGLFVLPSGRKPPNPSGITQSKAFLETIKNLEKSFDYVLIDTPPFGIITDSSALITQSDGVIVAVRFNKTTEVQLDNTMEQLHRVKANVLGTVLTAFDYKKSTDFHYSTDYYKEVYQDYNEYQEEEL